MKIDIQMIIGLLIAAVVVAVAAKRARMPYNIALVVGGVLLSIGRVFPQAPRLDPEIVFLICLPILLFEGGISANFRSIRVNAAAIGVLASLGTIVAAAVTGGALRFLLGIDWGPALLIGVMLAPTDTISTLFAFRRAPVPGRLSDIVQGETLFNDGTALVLYSALIGVLLEGGSGSIPAVTAQLILVSAGGLVAGAAVGLLGALVIRWLRDPLAEIMTTTALAYASYTIASEFGASGVIAAVVTGLVVGTQLRRSLAPTSQVAIRSFWDYAAFGVNTFIFLSVGMSTSPQALWENAGGALMAMIAMTAGRALAVYPLCFVVGRMSPAAALPMSWQHLLVAANIKGALSVALVLSLPASTPSRDLIVGVVFTATFLSLVLQGLSLPTVMRRLGLVHQDVFAGDISDQRARLVAARAAQHELEELTAAGLVSRNDSESLRSTYQTRVAAAERELKRLQEKHLAEGARDVLTMRRLLLDAERAGVAKAVRSGLLSEDAVESLATELDQRTLEIDNALAARIKESGTR